MKKSLNDEILIVYFLGGFFNIFFVLRRFSVAFPCLKIIVDVHMQDMPWGETSCKQKHSNLVETQVNPEQ